MNCHLSLAVSRLVASGACILILSLFGPAAGAQSGSGEQPLNEQQIIQKAKEEVMKELRESDFLRQQIQLGIQDYVRKQRAAQASAQAEQARLAAERAKAVRRVSTTRDHVYGNPEAPVSLIEYSDYECPFCKRFHQTAKQLIQAYDGKVNWVYRHFPLNIHNPGAEKEAEAAECVNELGGNDAFWKYTDAIYERTKSGGKGFPLDQLAPLAREIGLDEEQFAACYASGKYAGRVADDLREGARIGITGTPAVILFDHKTEEVALKIGALPFAEYKAVIDRMLSEK